MKAVTEPLGDGDLDMIRSYHVPRERSLGQVQDGFGVFLDIRSHQLHFQDLFTVVEDEETSGHV